MDEGWKSGRACGDLALLYGQRIAQVSVSAAMGARGLNGSLGGRCQRGVAAS